MVVMKKKTSKGKKRAVRGRPRMWRSKRANVGKYEVREQASLTEIVSPGQLLNANQQYSDYNLSLANLPRAKLIAQGYQYFRITRVTYTVKPLSDTFNAQGLVPGGSTASVPYLYYMIDRTKQFSNGFTLEMLRNSGAKPRRLDDKTLTFSLTPSVLTQTYDDVPSAQTAVQYRLKPWLPVRDINQMIFNASTIDHQGIVWFVEQTSGSPIGYEIERRVQIEFKKPCVPPPPPSVGAPIGIHELTPLPKDV